MRLPDRGDGRFYRAKSSVCNGYGALAAGFAIANDRIIFNRTGHGLSTLQDGVQPLNPDGDATIDRRTARRS
jgi:hypothetical protein